MTADPEAPRPGDPSEIFSDALELPAADRSAFLDARCGRETELRREVESLLGALGGARSLFRDLPAQLDVAGAWQGLGEVGVGSRLGPYRLEQRLAAGGMGVVYLARRVDQEFEKQVAIKLVHPTLVDAPLLGRFRNERQVLAALEHPGIARLIDGNTTDDGMPYLVMEYVDGEPIDAYCDGQRLTVEARLHLLLRVFDAVSFAHANLVIHRDLKPSNILVDRGGHPRLLDFGIAKVLRGSGADGVAGAADADLTVTGARAHTPRYASPEQLRGGKMATATDVYSLAVVSYELLAGVPPYRLDGRTALEVDRLVCEQTPPAPSQAARALPAAELSAAAGQRRTQPRRLVQRLGGDLDTVLLKALSKDPGRRYPTVGEFADDLRRHLEGLPVRARRDTTAYRVSKLVGRHKALAGGLLGVLATLAIALTLTVDAYRDATAQSREVQWLAYLNSLAAAEGSILLNKVTEARLLLDDAPSELRGWEWRHLEARLDRSRQMWSAHRSGVTGLALSSDGQLALTTSIDSTLAVWRVDDRVCLRRWRFGATVESASFDPHGRFVAVGLGSGVSRVIDGALDGLEQLGGAGTAALGLSDSLRPSVDPGVVVGEGPAWAFVDVRPDGRHVASAFFDGEVSVWDVATRSEAARWKAHVQLARAAYDPDGERIITAGSEGKVKVWDARSFAPIREFQAHDRRIYTFGLSRDGSKLVTGSMDRSAKVWDLESGRLLCAFRAHRATVTGVAFDAAANRVVTCAGDGQVLVWDAVTGEVLGELRGHRADATVAAATADGQSILTGDWAGNLALWDWSAEDVRILRNPSVESMINPVRSITLDPGGTRIIATTARDDVFLWTLGSAEPIALSLGLSRRAVFTTDGNGLLVGRDNGTVGFTALDSLSLTRVATLSSVDIAEQDASALRNHRAHGGPVLGMAADPRGGVVATSSADSTIRLWQIADTVLVRELQGHRGAVLDLKYSPDGRTLASCGTDSTLRLWDPDTGEARATLHCDSDALRELDYSPDARFIATVSATPRLRIWDLEAGTVRVLEPRAPAPLLSVAWSPDGSRVATGGTDEIVRLFDVPSGREVLALHGHAGRVQALVFTADGRALISASSDGTTRIWDARPTLGGRDGERGSAAAVRVSP